MNFLEIIGTGFALGFAFFLLINFFPLILGITAVILAGYLIYHTCKFFMNLPFKGGQESRMDRYAKRTTE